MLHFDQNPQPIPASLLPVFRRRATGNMGNRPMEARVKPEFLHLYPGVDPAEWYQVVQEGEYKDDMEGLWIQITDRVTYVLANHFDVQARPQRH
jgi:hypothetical protein